MSQAISQENPSLPAHKGLVRRSFLAGLAVTVPIAATAPMAALAAPGGADAELVALANELADLLPEREAAADEVMRCELAYRASDTQYPAAMLWRPNDPVPHTRDKHITEDGQVRYWCNEAAIKKLPGRTFQKWQFVGNDEERQILSIHYFEDHEIKPVLRYEHCFRGEPDHLKAARAKELMTALDEHDANLVVVYEQSGMEAAEERYDQITDRMSDLFHRIKDLKAETLDGYRAKALAVVLNCWDGEIEPDRYMEEGMLAAICSDLTGIPVKAAAAI
jgi:hypothetical protein